MKPDHVLDLSGLNCPMPLLKTKLQLSQTAPGQIIHVIASDPGSAKDIPAWLALTGHELQSQYRDEEGRCHFVIISANGAAAC